MEVKQQIVASALSVHAQKTPRGVTLCSHGYGYTARCRGKYLGFFSSVDEASMAYERALAAALGVDEEGVSGLTNRGGAKPAYTVDPQFEEEVSRFAWTFGSKGYAQRSSGGRTQKLHQFVWELSGQIIPKGLTLDHINRDKLDNRLCNLRLATPRMQAMNRVMPKGNLPVGVTFVAACALRPYRVYVGSKYVGTYATPEEAASAYRVEFDAAWKREEARVEAILKGVTNEPA
jgi:hypothetical protein